MSDSEWDTDKYDDMCYGPITDNELRNTNGVCINTYGNYVCIAHYD